MSDTNVNKPDSPTDTSTGDGVGLSSDALLAFGVVMIDGTERKSAVIFATSEDEIREHLKSTNEKGFVSSISRQSRYDMFRVTHKALVAYNPTVAFRG